MRCGRSWGLSSEARREGQTFAGASLLVRYVNFVKLPHTVFALPFALLGLLVASRHYAVTWRTLALVVLAFTGARFVALGFNRIADRDLDAKNPRTRARELPAGRLESAVVRLGARRAILAGKLLHGLALGALVLFGIGAGLGAAYYAGVALGAALIAWEHQLVQPEDLSRLDAAFFGANGLVSVVVFLGALVDRVL